MWKLIRNHRLQNLLLLPVCLTALLVLAAESAVIGTWQSVSHDTPLGNITWEMTIKDKGGELAGTMSSEELGTFRLSDLKLDGDTFVFVFYPVGNHVTVETELQSGKMIGTWQIDAGPGGEFLAERAPDTAGTPSQ